MLTSLPHHVVRRPSLMIWMVELGNTRKLFPIPLLQYTLPGRVFGICNTVCIEFASQQYSNWTSFWI